MMVADTQLWQSEMFTKGQMVPWEGKPMAGMTWTALRDYFTEKWLERKQYSATTAKQSCFKEAALLTQEAAAAKEEGETQAMLFAVLQDQHTKQIAQMEAANKTNMDLMMERMNALITASGGRLTHQPNKENTPLTGNIKPPTGSGERVKKPRKKRRYAPTAKCSFSTSLSCAMNWRQIRPHATPGGSPYSQRPQLLDRDWGRQ
jgi:hypothetical protein